MFLEEGNENVLKWIKLMIAQLCEYTKNHSIAMVSELYLNKAVL